MDLFTPRRLQLFRSGAKVGWSGVSRTISSDEAVFCRFTDAIKFNPRINLGLSSDPELFKPGVKIINWWLPSFCSMYFTMVTWLTWEEYYRQKMMHGPCKCQVLQLQWCGMAPTFINDCNIDVKQHQSRAMLDRGRPVWEQQRHRLWQTDRENCVCVLRGVLTTIITGFPPSSAPRLYRVGQMTSYRRLHICPNSRPAGPWQLFLVVSSVSMWDAMVPTTWPGIERLGTCK